MIQQKKCCADLFIMDQFEGCEELAVKIRGQRIFDKIVVVNEKQLYKDLRRSAPKIIVRFKLLLLYLKVSKIVPSVFKELDGYSDLYISSQALVGRLVCIYCQKNKFPIQYHYFDDGMGSYDDSTYYVSKIDKILRFLLFGKNTINVDYQKDLYCPELYESLHPSDSCLLLNRIEFLDSNQLNRQIIRNIFPVDSISIISEKFILFDTVREEEFTPKGSELFEHIVEIMTDFISPDDIIVKAHPRDQRNRFSLKYYDTPSIPFECNCIKQNMDHKVLISCFSTSVFMPKIMFHQEPIVILLYNLLKPYRIKDFEKDEELCYSLRKIYYHPKRVIIPKSLKELKQTFRQMQKEI